MKIELPSAEEFCKNLDAGSGDWFHIDFMITTLKKYGELCAKYGAKSIRGQAIDLVDENTWTDDFGHGVVYADYVVAKIQNLEP